MTVGVVGTDGNAESMIQTAVTGGKWYPYASRWGPPALPAGRESERPTQSREIALLDVHRYE
ncbi:MAG: hypothetical protein ACYC18_02400, partial [Gammaproteobacteria bacterium]